MSEKYRATIRGDRIEWEGETPEGLGTRTSIEVEIIPVAEKRRKRGNGRRMAEALASIAALGGVSSIKDPVKWQREIREDRSLPGRD